jgi:N-acetylmuramoyl-L-alanine amidase
MQINDERLYNDDLTSFPFIRSANIGRRLRSREFIVIHYTEGQSATAAIEWLTIPKSQVSSHIVIARDGTITQLVPFDTIAWHAGESYWKGMRYLNYYSIGIELDNAGRMTRNGNIWRASFKKDYPEGEVMEAIHKFDRKPYGWHNYPSEQIQAMIDLCKLLVTQYGSRKFSATTTSGQRRNGTPALHFQWSMSASRSLDLKETRFDGTKPYLWPILRCLC